MPADNRLAEAVKRLRMARGWTMTELSERTGLSLSTLSKVERGKLSLTYDRLMQLAEGLQVEITELFRDSTAGANAHPPNSRKSITRAGDGYILDTPQYHYNYLFTDLLARSMTPIVGAVKARTLQEFGPLIRHEGEEFTYVLEGLLELHTDTYAPIRLAAGESVYFDSRMGHAYLNAGDGICRTITVCSAQAAPLMREMEQRGAPSKTL